jgi:hypothetical protein
MEKSNYKYSMGKGRNVVKGKFHEVIDSIMAFIAERNVLINLEWKKYDKDKNIKSFGITEF